MKSTINGMMGMVALAKAIGVDKGQLSREAADPTFPKVRAGGKWRYCAKAVRNWRELNIKPRSADPGGPAIVTASDDPDSRVLQEGTAPALEVARSAMRLCAKRVAAASAAGHVSSVAMDALTSSLRELRAAEESFLDLAQQRGELVEMSLAKQVIGETVSLSIEAIDRIGNSITTAAMSWRASDLGPDDFRAMVAAWFDSQVTDVRGWAADRADELIEAAQKKQ
jgi:hypothetical protein